MSAFMLAQIGLDPRAAAGGEALATFLVLSVLTLTAAATAIIVIGFHRRGGRCAARFLRSVVIATAAVAILIEFRSTLPRNVSLDFSNTHADSDVDWPANRTQDFYSIQGGLQLRIRMPGGKTFTDRAQSISLFRDGQLVKRVQVFGLPMRLDDAVRRLEQLSNEWDFPLSHLARWEQGAGRGDLSSFTTVSRSFPSDPSISVEVFPTYLTDRPWHIVFEIYWRRHRTTALAQ